MISGETVLCFAPDPWDDIWRNRHQIMSRLARRNLVVYVEPRPYLRHVLKGLRRGVIRPWQMGARLRHVADGLYVYSPPLWAPISGREPLRTATRWLRERRLKRVLRGLGGGRPILWLVRPDQADLPGHWNEKACVYQIVDEYSGYTGLGTERRQAILERERRLIQRADIVFVTAPSLLERKGRYNPRTYLVPNAVDSEAFAEALARPAMPSDLEALPRPRIGYVGAVNDKVDFGLLREVAQRRPNWSVVLVGPWAVREDTDAYALREQQSVHFLGKRDVGQVPHYVAGLDVCLMPYKLNEWTLHINPLKMYEYLAAGRPVVSTPIPAAASFSGWISVAEGADAFMEAVEKALAEDDVEQREKRVQAVAQHTWDARVELISEKLAEFLQAQSGAVVKTSV